MNIIDVRDVQELTDSMTHPDVHYVVHEGAELQLYLDVPQQPTDRCQRTVELRGRGARVNITSAWHGQGAAVSALNLDIDHVAPETWSRADIRAVLDNESRLIFTGMLHIRPGAMKSDTFLRQDALLLSPQARADSTPSLEIEADDVKAGHAATAKPIDREQLFYLRSRGLDRTIAIAHLVDAFVGSVRLRKHGIG